MTRTLHLDAATPALRPELLATVERACGSVATAAISRMERALPWFADLPAETRSWIGLVAQAGLAAFVDWYQQPVAERGVPFEIFSVAPRELAHVVSLRQTVDMVQIAVDVMEEHVAELASGEEEGALREAVLRYSRDVAFAAAQVYAAAAEQRGAWDARLEALVVDALVRDEADESLQSQAAALGWTAAGPIVVLTGARPRGITDGTAVMQIHRAARSAGLRALAGTHGSRLVVVIGDATNPQHRAAKLDREFGSGPIVIGPPVSDLLSASRSARAALTGHRVAAAWPSAPRMIEADDLLPERALDGDDDARAHLVEHVYEPIHSANGDLLETVSAYLDHGTALEATARDLYVHANTVRYRLKRVSELTGYAATTPRDAFTLQVALALGRLQHAAAL
ncbi:MAG: PucR family transcriptional regulator [Actinomycetes bacterium]